MEVKASEQALYEEIGRLHVASKALVNRVQGLTAENARLRNDVDRLASELPEAIATTETTDASK